MGLYFRLCADLRNVVLQFSTCVRESCSQIGSCPVMPTVDPNDVSMTNVFMCLVSLVSCVVLECGSCIVCVARRRRQAWVSAGSARANRVPTGVMVTMRSPSAVGSFRPMGADTWSVGLWMRISKRSSASATAICSPHSMRMMVRVPGLRVPRRGRGIRVRRGAGRPVPDWGVVIGSKPVGIHVVRCAGSAVREGAVEFPGDGEGR